MFLIVGSDPSEAKDIPVDRGNYWYMKSFLHHKHAVSHHRVVFAWYSRPFAANIGVQVLLPLCGKCLGLVIPYIFDGICLSFLPDYKHCLMQSLI